MMRKAGVAIFLVFCALQVRAEFVPVRIEDMPRLLSETRVFQDLQSLRINSAFMPYELNVSFWSDGAHKQRWMYLPGKIEYSATNEWKFPSGTVFVKHFEIGTQRRRLETRLLVRDGTGGVCGVSYKWREKGDDADLVRDRIQTERWQFPGPADCIVCHNAGAGGVLGLNARQINCGNQLRRWNEAGLFDLRLTDEELGNAPKLVRVNDANASIECRARAYVDVNCAFCHRPGAPGNFDARWPTVLAQQNLIDGAVMINLGIDGARAIAPGDPWRSIILVRMVTLEQTKMPPLAHQALDLEGIELLTRWIESLDGLPVLRPPAIAINQDRRSHAATVRISHADAKAVIRYTLDGSFPGNSAPIYDKPLRLERAATVRANALRTGFKRSIAVEETYIPAD